MNNLFQKQNNEVMAIEQMFSHLQKSIKEAGMSRDTFKFFGFPETTIHYHIYRMMKLEEKELSNKFRYRDQDENGLERCLAMLKAYETVVNETERTAMNPLSKETLEFMLYVSDLYPSKAA